VSEGGDHRAPLSRWYIKATALPPFLEVIEPHLILKRQQARLLLDFLARRKTRQGSKHGKFVSMTNEEHDRDQETYDLLRTLNARGVEKLLTTEEVYA